MKKPVIGIVGRVGMDEEGDQCFISYEKTRLAILRCGGIPMILLPSQQVKYYEHTHDTLPLITEEEKQDLYAQLDLVDGLLLPGGYRWFTTYDVVLVKEALKRNMPILGICAGMQMLGTLFSEERIIVKNETSINHHQRNLKYVHQAQIQPSTKLANIVGTETISVNSFHRYHLSKAPKYVVNAISEDGYIEGIELPDKKFVLGVQWHPESMLEYNQQARSILNAFINASISYRKS